jgi:hypothetical protein
MGIFAPALTSAKKRPDAITRHGGNAETHADRRSRGYASIFSII